MKRILIDVDTQHDFMHKEGALYVPASTQVHEAIRRTLLDESYDAVIGSVDSHAYDSWEFKENGGPFPAHCVKGSRGWLRTFEQLPKKRRFIPMSPYAPHYEDRYVLVGENKEGSGARKLTPYNLAVEATSGVSLYFEKEVYSLFDNPFAMPVLSEIGSWLTGDWNEIQIDVIGYCTGGYCVDAAVKALVHERGINRADIRVLSYATAAIGGPEGMEKSRQELTSLASEVPLARGVTWVESP